MKKIFSALVILGLVTACAHGRRERYEALLDPLRGKSNKVEIARLLGNPVFCKSENGGERCEYRTAHGRNEPVPSVHQKTTAMGPDLSPYDYFDVIQVNYDGFGTLREWAPIVLKP